MANKSLAALQSYQRLRRLALAVLLALVGGVLLFGQSIFPPDTVVHEVVEMAGIVLIILGGTGRLVENCCPVDEPRHRDRP